MASQRAEEEQMEKAFTISDKRLFTKEGLKRTPGEAAETSAGNPTPPAAASPPPPPPPPRTAREMPPPPPRPEAAASQSREMPAADFSTFVIMLANNVMMWLGQIPDPATQQRRRDLGQAQHTIDILLMLREKTQGNRTPEEEQLMQELLPQLQVAFVHAKRQVG